MMRLSRTEELRVFPRLGPSGDRVPGTLLTARDVRRTPLGPEGGNNLR